MVSKQWTKWLRETFHIWCWKGNCHFFKDLRTPVLRTLPFLYTPHCTILFVLWCQSHALWVQPLAEQRGAPQIKSREMVTWGEFFSSLLTLCFFSLCPSLQSPEWHQNIEWQWERTDGVRLDWDSEFEGLIYSSLLLEGNGCSERASCQGSCTSLHWPLGVRSPMFFTRRWLKSASSPSPRGPCMSGLMRPWRWEW